MLNRVILIGRLTRDPEFRFTPNGNPVCTFTLAVDRGYKKAQGERETDFIDIVAWTKLAETCNNFLTKGRLVCIEGRLQIRSYETQDGQKRKAAEVVASNMQMLERKPQGDSPQPKESFEENTEELLDEVPF
ncbi:MAG: single-stranded DNA-binding protein [Armatimonadetes bacterium]|nr:single-stranded DNA-binding protein [Armatimonadota bacterium]